MVNDGLFCKLLLSCKNMYLKMLAYHELIKIALFQNSSFGSSKVLLSSIKKHLTLQFNLNVKITKLGDMYIVFTGHQLNKAGAKTNRTSFINIQVGLLCLILILLMCNQYQLNFSLSDTKYGGPSRFQLFIFNPQNVN